MKYEYITKCPNCEHHIEIGVTGEDNSPSNDKDIVRDKPTSGKMKFSGHEVVCIYCKQNISDISNEGCQILYNS